LAGERGGVARREVSTLVAPQNAEPRRLTVLGEADEFHEGLLGGDGCARIIPRLFRAFPRGAVCYDDPESALPPETGRRARGRCRMTTASRLMSAVVLVALLGPGLVAPLAAAAESETP